MALPNNKIPRVFINTGIEYTAIVEFVKELAEKDDRFVIIQPKVPVKKMLDKGINLTLGSNGIFKRAKLAEQEYLNAEASEEEKIRELEERLAEMNKNLP